MQFPHVPESVRTDFPVRYSQTTTLIGTLFFLVGTLVPLFFIALILYRVYSQKPLRVIVHTVLSILFGLFVMNFGMFLYFYELFISHSEHSFLLVNNGFMVNFVFWILGVNLFIYRTARVPLSRRRNFRIAFGVMWLEMIVIAIFGFYSIIAMYSHIVGLLAMIASVLGLVTYIIFNFVLGKEISKNSSKLSQARLKMLQQMVQLQITWIIFVVLNVILTETDHDELGQYPLLVIPITTILTSLLAYWTIHIPTWIRSKYNLLPSRFKAIRAIV